MTEVFQELQHRNALLYYAGFVNLLGAIVCMALILIDKRQLGGISIWIKPLKFFLSIMIFHWTMAWYLHDLSKPVAVKWYSIMAVAVLAFEMVVIAGQAARGQLSHFNISTPVSGLLFSLMGVAIVILTSWTAVMGVMFWMKTTPDHLSAGYWWGIRLGIMVFVVFAFEGGLMAGRLQHTVGAPDGGPGIPLLNWSKNNGDLRVAHFVGMHALQVLPFLGCWLLKKPAEIIVLSFFYAVLAVYLFVRALGGKPLFW
jgi:hypothetical protein